ncbi:hypothetical protein JXA88_00450 [Candidatus Fermentibacteria bacterium]|nr:hypothetical protein [Candidatus Fermentibacteria bacterium]
MHKPWVIVFLLAAATAIRTIGLDRIPPGLWSDEANHGLEAEAILEGGPRPVFFPGNCGQEPLYKYLAVATGAVLGHGVAALRLPSALAGSLLVLLTWCWVRRTRSREEALWATLLVAVGVWPLHFSRIAFRANLGPTLGLAALLAVDSYARRPCAWRGVVAGLSAAALWYTYPAFRLFPVLPALWLLMHTRGRAGLRRWVSPAAAFVVGLLPLLWAWTRVPELVTARTSMASLWSETPDPVAGFLRNVVAHAAMFTIAGDRNPRHNLSGEPQLDVLTGFLFVAGIAVALARRDKADRLLLAWLAIQLMPGVLSVERQAPHCLRTLGVLPVPYLLAAGGFVQVRRFLGSRWTPVLSLVVAVAVSTVNLGRYFVLWPRSLDRLHHAEEALYGFHRSEYALGRWLKEASPGTPIFLSPQLYLHWTTEYMAQGAQYGIVTDDSDLAPGDVIALQLHPRNAWWMRDDFRKNFFAIWRDLGRVSPEEIWRAITYAYPECTAAYELSDSLLLERLSERVALRELAPLDGVSRFQVVRHTREDVLPWDSGRWRRIPPGCFAVEITAVPPGSAGLALVAREETSSRRWALDHRDAMPGEGAILRGCLLFPACVRLEAGDEPLSVAARWRYSGPPDVEPYLRHTLWGKARTTWARFRSWSGL